MCLLCGQPHSARLLCSMTPLSLQKGFYYRLRDARSQRRNSYKILAPGGQGLSEPHRLSLDLAKWCPCAKVWPRTARERSRPPRVMHTTTQLSSQNYLLTSWTHPMSPIPHLQFLYLLQLGVHLSCSAETTLVKVIISNPHVAESHEAPSVHIILHESTAFTMVTHFLSINALSSLGFQDTRLWVSRHIAFSGSFVAFFFFPNP